MSEPHELEERVARLIDPEKWREIDECAAISAADPASRKCETCPLIAEKSLEAARAVLALVRQEQENDGHRIEDNGIHRWWLSHTAKETSNG